MNKLILEKRGCNFWSDEKITSDVGNYRVCTKDEIIEGKDGNLYFLEFTLWRNKGHYRTLAKRTNKPLKKPIFEIDNPMALAIDTQYTDANGCWSNIKLEKKIHEKNLSYTKKDILKAVNFISKIKYDTIEII